MIVSITSVAGRCDLNDFFKGRRWWWPYGSAIFCCCCCLLVRLMWNYHSIRKWMCIISLLHVIRVSRSCSVHGIHLCRGFRKEFLVYRRTANLPGFWQKLEKCQFIFSRCTANVFLLIRSDAAVIAHCTCIVTVGNQFFPFSFHFD